MSSPYPRTQSRKRPTSKSRPESPSSVITVQRIVSPTFHNGPQNLYPASVLQHSALAETKPISPELRSKRRRSHSRPKSVVGFAEGIVNSNRWSQSTASSKSSGPNHKRRNSFAKRLSGSFQSLSTYNHPPSPTVSKNVLRKMNPPPNPLNLSGLAPPTASKTPPIRTPPIPSGIPPAGTLPALARAVDAAPTPQGQELTTPNTSDLLPSATYMPGDGDYFGEAWAGTSPAKSRKLQRSPSNSSYMGSPSAGNAKPGPSTSFASSPNPMESSPARERPPPPISKLRSRMGLTSNGESSEQVQNRSEAELPSLSGTPHDRRKSRHRKAPSQKAMLAKALAKANHAVVLDNAQNFESAIGAYADACNLLHNVMSRTHGDEDKKKLEAIKQTYTARILELESNELALANNFTDKALPEVPQTVLRNSIEAFAPSSDEEDVRRGPQEDDEQPGVLGRPFVSRTLTREQLPPRRQSLMPRDHSTDGLRMEASPVRRDPDLQQPPVPSVMLNVPMEPSYMPPPLSPRRPSSPLPAEIEQVPKPASAPASVPAPVPAPASAPEPFHLGHARHETAESTSWLDTIGESGGSSDASSVHSKASLEGYRRKHIRMASGDTEAEFDAALDAAVEAAYDDGFEPASDPEIDFDEEPTGAIMDPTERIAEVRRNVDIAKQKVREAEREAAIASAKEREKLRLIEGSRSVTPQLPRRQSEDANYNDDEAEEEERILEEMTRGYVMEDGDYDSRTKSALPRESDSSGFSRRTGGSSIGSMPATTGTGTPLSTVAETATGHQMPNIVQKRMGPFSQPASSAVPSHPATSAASEMTPLVNEKPSIVPSLSILTSPGVRERRLSGQKVKQLKIDTHARFPGSASGPKTQPPSKLGLSVPGHVAEGPKSAAVVRDGQVDSSGTTLKSALSLTSHLASPSPGPGSAEPLSGVSDATARNAQAKDGQPVPLSGSPVRQGKSGHNVLRKNFSSSSLKSLGRTPPTTEDSPGTPLSRVFSSSAAMQRNVSVPSVPDLPTPSLANFTRTGVSVGTLSFFDNDIHSPTTPGSPNPHSTNAPVPLEPCPESFLLRPFWLLRAVYQTLAHPRGGYITSRLFVPRDVWRVKNVKLKNVDEKVSSCDLLTAALLKLSKVDMEDADAVMEEMQAFELVLDQVQATLGKKLGGDVGVQGSMYLFKGAAATDDNDLLSAKTPTATGKYLSSWRKLRSKNSTAPGPSGSSSGQGRDGSRDALTLKSLPMTTMMNPRFTKRDPTKVLGIGPHAHYMAALARLCDAVQVIDQIARQVEDPGLRLSSQTHVGLELSTRHAAEFFAFYVCRFAMTDIGMMLDKFVKRGSEWVMG